MSLSPSLLVPSMYCISSVWRHGNESIHTYLLSRLKDPMRVNQRLGQVVECLEGMQDINDSTQNLKCSCRNLQFSPCMQKSLILTHSVESCHNSFSLPNIQFLQNLKWTVGRNEVIRSHNTPERFIMCENWEPRNQASTANNTLNQLRSDCFQAFPTIKCTVNKQKLDGGKKGQVELRLMFFSCFFSQISPVVWEQQNLNNISEGPWA